MAKARALWGSLAGGLGIGFAAAATVTTSLWFLAAAAVCTAAAVALLFFGPDRVFSAARERNHLRSEAQRLTRESDRLAARAAEAEAEAIAAKAELTRALQTQPGTDNGSGPGIIDPQTGVFSQLFFEATLSKRISAARRGLRPLSLALIQVVVDLGTDRERPAEAKRVADGLVETLREADTVALLEDGTFAVLLEDTPENGAIWTLERVRRCLSEGIEHATVRAGLSCYPAFAFDAEQIVEQARDALTTANEWRQDRIEVTTANPDA